MIKHLILYSFFFLLAECGAKENTNQSGENENITKQNVISVLRKQVLKEAEWALQQDPVTVTAQTSERSAGGKHDFYSEGDYWWPNPVSPDSPYIQRDGMTLRFGRMRHGCWWRPMSCAVAA